MDSPAADIHSTRTDLLAWFDANARDLPWRRTDDPYAVWVSEVMLQQTRVDTVVPYFERWMERYPTVHDLAAADRDDVLKSWEGLGYYRRARMLHRAAAVVRDRHGGEVPRSVAGLRKLPGVGEYTAGAVASIAFGQAVPAVDGNVRRVLARVFDLADPRPSELRDRASGLVDPRRPGDFNQALMELGATVCTPTSPSCGVCPLGDACRARALGVQHERPLPRRRAPVPERRYGVAVVVRDGPGASAECLMVRRPPDGLLGGLWEFPSYPVEADEPSEVGTGPDADGPSGATAGAARAAARGLLAAVGPRSVEATPLPTVTHAYSHFVGRYDPFVLHHPGGRHGDAAGLRGASPAGSPDFRGAPAGGAHDGPGAPDPAGADREARWVPLDGLGGLAVPVAQRRIAEAALALTFDGPQEDP